MFVSLITIFDDKIARVKIIFVLSLLNLITKLFL